MADQRRARSGVCGVARVLLFVQATRLAAGVPATDSADRALALRSAPPHGSRKHFYVDEPSGRAVAACAAERNAWAPRHRFELAASEWPGMYAPDAGSVLYMLCCEPAIVRRTLGGLAGRPPDPEAEAWDGESTA